MFPRIIIVVHGHPSISKGGTEVAAYNFFKEFKRQGAACLFVARSDEPSHGCSAFSVVGDGELLFHTRMSDFFLFRSAEPSHITHNFRQLLESFKPDVVHFHHYVHLGLEMIPEVRRTSPNAKVFVTLHEFLAICHHNGQMVKTETHNLCYRASPKDCSYCFKDRSPGDFFLRERYIKAIFEEVTGFIAPSHFLKSRYVAWGLPEDKIQVIENGQPKVERLPPRPLAEGEVRGRFAYFGQISPYKGVDILLEAFCLLPNSICNKVRLDIHGANLEKQEPEFQKKIRQLLEKLGKNVSWHGPYEADEMPLLLADIDWVVIPSIWWENSPLVIQEAYNFGRPVITANIGGMAEKNLGSKAETQFSVRNAVSLSQVVVKLVEKYNSKYADSQFVIPNVCLLEETARQHLNQYVSPY
jgi:glycosyltransferase involved in cell wall biosynthesis